MGLEVATYINELQATNPTSSDIKSQGDDHLRVIKGAIKNTFPNITGAVTVTQTQLNSIAGDGRLVEPGLVVMWPYSVASIPAGWKVCNGTGTLRDGRAVPNLVDRFPVGAGGTIGILATGGAATHTHTLTIAETALTIAQMPSHNHGFHTINTPTTELRPGIGGAEANTGTANQYPYDYGRIQATGGGAAHGHAGSTATASNHLPPYIGMIFIIKD
ncbi:tail protein [Pseudomonas phage Bjorn]|uniref:Tail fiber protein n=1 Tax=Pseudomonas phage Bjorn TaxID=2079288 RepID=A0A2K9VHC1_9CAUD|nr:tail protein [Pseudomonas phage Bjorn]AUV61756.1 tail fiber protein [Pseudomonas phage Bjorn]